MKTKKKYLYAISYWFTDSEGRTGQGCNQIYRDTKINTLVAFNELGTKIKEVNNFKTVVICNIMLLGKERMSDG